MKTNTEELATILEKFLKNDECYIRVDNYNRLWIDGVIPLTNNEKYTIKEILAGYGKSKDF